jgi:hypothetical protein
MAPTAEPAAAADLPAIVDTFVSAFDKTPYIEAFPPVLGTREWIREGYGSFIEQDIDRNESRLFVVRDENGSYASLKINYEKELH